MKPISIQLPILIVVALVVAGGAFYGGMAYGKTTSSGSSQGGVAQFRQGGAGGAGGVGGVARRAGGGGGFTTGTVASMSPNGFTVEIRGGGSKVVIVASSTSIGKMTSGSIADVTAGANVVVSGTTNSDGSITASTVQLRPEGSPMPGFGGLGQGSATGTPPGEVPMGNPGPTGR